MPQNSEESNSWGKRDLNKKATFEFQYWSTRAEKPYACCSSGNCSTMVAQGQKKQFLFSSMACTLESDTASIPIIPRQS